MAAEISSYDLPCLFYCMEGEYEHISRNSVWASRTTTINCSVGFIDLYSLFPTNLRIVLPQHNVTLYFYSIRTVERSPSCGRPLPPKIQSCQIAQTKRKWSSDELRYGSNNKEGSFLKQNSLVVLCEMVHLNYRGTQRQFSKNSCLEDDLRSRILGTFAGKFLACLPLLGFSNI